jgi:Zn-dependent M28 family amino/carboxypeptidase
MGLEPLPSLQGYRQPISPALGDNVMGFRPARGRSAARWLLIGAHYDHLGESFGRVYAGADDNASAVAILLETARTLAPLSHYSVLFVAFNAEEPPFIRTSAMGSQHFIDHLPAEITAPSEFQAAIIMDLMGGAHWQPLQDVIFVAGGEKSPGLFGAVKDVNRETLNVRGSPGSSPLTPNASRLTVLPVGMHLIEEIPVVGRVPFSDYDAFRNRSVPFLFLSAGRTPRYHQPTDLPDTLHYERMASTVRWLQRLTQRIDQDDAPYEFEPAREEVADEVASLRPFVAQAAEWETRIPGTSPVSLLRFKLDARWIERLDPETATSDDLKRLERVSLRIQCLLADFYGCFLI